MSHELAILREHTASEQRVIREAERVLSMGDARPHCDGCLLCDAIMVITRDANPLEDDGYRCGACGTETIGRLMQEDFPFMVEPLGARPNRPPYSVLALMHEPAGGA